MPLPDLADLDAFVSVARARSFRAAAALAGVSASGLSEAVRRLEARLEVRLLNRSTRSVTPTEAGERLLGRLEPALTEVATAVEAVTEFRGRHAGTLRLNAPTFVAQVVLPPIVEPFLASYPEITLELIGDDSFIDVLAAGFDAGIRYEERLERDMIAIPIGPRRQRFATAASPAYLRHRGQPAHPRDLLAHSCIRHRFASGISPVWEFERDGELVRVATSGRLVTNTVAAQLSAAVAGLGVVTTFEDALAAELEAGLLEPVLPDWWQSFSGPFLYYPSRRLMPGPLRALVDYVKATPPTSS